jgi:hypothetical protein
LLLAARTLRNIAEKLVQLLRPFTWLFPGAPDDRAGLAVVSERR